MKKSMTQMKNELRASLIEDLLKRYDGEDVGQYNSHAINMPIVLEDGSEGFATFTISIPSLEYDGYQERIDYERKVREDEAKAKAKAEAAAKKSGK